MLKILIDSDGCPVVDIAVRQAKKNGIRCIIICDTSHHFDREGAETVVVSKGADSVDFKLVNMLERGDIAVTQDWALAAMCLARGAYPIRQDGLIYDSGNIDALLSARHTAMKIRRGGGRIKGASKRCASEDEAFERALCQLIEGLQTNNTI